ncbi:hypothetical protein [Virgibacillus kimchii]
MSRKEIIINYELGHTIEFSYTKSNMYCPSCGRQSVWSEESEGDFYCGPDYACSHCKASFSIQLGTNENSFEGEQLIKQIRDMPPGKKF